MSFEEDMSADISSHSYVYSNGMHDKFQAAGNILPVCCNISEG